MVVQVDALNPELAGVEPALVEEWLSFLQATDQMYRQVADERSEPYVPLSEAEMHAAAGLAAGLRVHPRDAVARHPAWCVLRPRLRSQPRPLGVAQQR